LTEQDKKIPLFPILLVNFTGTLGFSIVLPFLVFLVTRFGGNAFVYGLLGAVYPAFQLIGAPLLGKWSDIYGRKSILLVSQAGTFIGWLIFFAAFFIPMTTLLDVNLPVTGEFIFTLPLLILFIARAIDGLTGGNISVANAYLADITEEKDRNKNYGKMSISSNLGFVAGPMLAGLLGSTALKELPPVIAAIIISLAAVVLILFFLPDSRPCVYMEDPERINIKKFLGFQNKECFKIKGESKISVRNVMKIKFIPYIFVLYFLIFLGFNFFYTAFPIHVVEKLGWSITQMGIYFSVLSILMVIVQGPVLSYASKKFSDGVLIIIGNLILGTNFVLLLSGNVVIIYAAAVFFALGNGLMWPSVLSLLSKAAGKVYQGSVQGVASSLGSLASIVGLIAGGMLYTELGTVTFLIAAVTIYLVFLMSFRLPKIEKICRFNNKLTPEPIS
jgi:DHA1 family tetracycline resistance protein-like MFS transporter